MASKFQRQQIQEYLCGDEAQCLLAKSESLHKKSFVTIDLNRPGHKSTLKASGDPLHLLLDATNFYHNKKELERALMRATNKRCYLERELSLSKKITNLDLTLKLSPPGSNSKVEPSSRSSSFSSTRASCISKDFNPNEAPPPNNIDFCDEAPPSASLILMGCQSCLIYVMVPENDPHCPKCKNGALIDTFRGGPTKKTRRN